MIEYGEDSEGIELNTMLKCLGTDIEILFVRENNSALIDMADRKYNIKVLLLTPGHYDILYTMAEVQQL